MNTKLFSFILVGAMAAVAAPVCAQQASDPARSPPAATQAQNTPAASNVASDADEAAETAAVIAKANAAAAKAASLASTKATQDASVSKKARDAGWHPETHNGETVYCRDDPMVGSRFTTRRCVNESHLLVLLEQAQLDKDALKSRGCGGAACGGSSK